MIANQVTLLLLLTISLSPSTTATTLDLVYSFDIGFAQPQQHLSESPTTAYISKDSIAAKPDKDSLLSLGNYRVDPHIHSSALSILNSKEIGSERSLSLPQLLTGKIPGLFVVPMSFQPGNEEYLLMARGTNSFGYSNPLFVVDGVPDRDISLIDADDIERIVLLKDGTSALYGSRGSNGVLYIETRHGNVSRPTLTIRLNQGFSQPTRIPEMADAATYATMENELSNYQGGGDIYSPEEILKFINGSDRLKYPNTDWFNSTYKKVSWLNSVYANFKGGTPHFQYFTSAGTKYQDGIHKNSAYKSRLNHFRINIDSRFNIFQLGVGLSYQQQTSHAPNNSESTVFSSMFSAKPTEVDFWPGGKPNGDFEYDEFAALLPTNFFGSNELSKNYLHGNVKLNMALPFIKGLNINTLYAFDQRKRGQHNTKIPYTLYFWDGVSLEPSGDPLLTSITHQEYLTQIADQNQFEQNSYNYNLNYYNSFNHLIISFNAGVERFNTNYSIRHNSKTYNGSTLDTTGVSDNRYRVDKQKLNYMGSINLRFLNRYVFEITGNYSKSPLLYAPNAKQTFYSASMAWVISNESFWKESVRAINFLTIRSSWGTTGNESTEMLDYITQIEYSPFVKEVINPDMQMKTSRKLNIGLDGQLLSGVIAFEIDLFSSLRNGIYKVDASIPGEYPYKLRNRGLDFRIAYNKTTDRFSFLFSMSGSYARNKVLEYNDTPGIPSYQQYVGKPFSSFELLYMAEGIYKDELETNSTVHMPDARPGEVRFKNVNQDQDINGLDRVRTDRDIMPRFQGGAEFQIHYRQFDLSLFFQAATGGMFYVPYQGLGDNSYYFNEYAKHRWTSENNDSDYPRVTYRDNDYWKSHSNTFWLRSTDYVRLKNTEVGYTLKNSDSNSLKMKQFRICIRGFNLFTMDKLKLVDPEIPYQRGNSYLKQGLSYEQYPICRYFQIGLTCTF